MLTLSKLRLECRIWCVELTLRCKAVASRIAYFQGAGFLIIYLRDRRQILRVMHSQAEPGNAARLGVECLKLLLCGWFMMGTMVL